VVEISEHSDQLAGRRQLLDAPTKEKGSSEPAGLAVSDPGAQGSKKSTK
jgi:hypothetical protein